MSEETVFLLVIEVCFKSLFTYKSYIDKKYDVKEMVSMTIEMIGLVNTILESGIILLCIVFEVYLLFL